MTEMAGNVKKRSIVEDFKKIQREVRQNQKEMEVLKKETVSAKGGGKEAVGGKNISMRETLPANEWFEKGLQHTVSREEALAIEEFTRVIALNPDYAEAYHHRGIAYYNRGLTTNDKAQFELAANDFRKVIALKPRSREAIFAQAAIYLFQEQYDQAIGELDKAIAAHPDEAVSYVGRGFIYTREKRKNPRRAIEDFSRAIALGGPWTPMAYMNRGAVLLDEKRFSEAANDFNRVIELTPRNAKAYLGRGVCQAFQGQFSKAIEDINKSIELDPKSPDAYNIRGMVYAQIGNPRAISDFQKACDMGHAQGCSNWQRILKSR